MNETLIASGLMQVTWAVWLGWPLLLFHSGRAEVGPLRSARRLLQAHLDNVFMGTLQMVIGAVHPQIPAAAGWLLLAGSWANPQLFLLQAMRPERTLAERAGRWLASPSFLALTIAYSWLAWSWMAG